MRDQAQKLEQAAERATDPAERLRLKDKAQRILDQSKKESGRGSGGHRPHVMAPVPEPAGGRPRDLLCVSKTPAGDDVHPDLVATLARRRHLPALLERHVPLGK